MEKKQIVSLICTHQARLRCLLHDLYIQNLSNIGGNDTPNIEGGFCTKLNCFKNKNQYKMHRFMNGCILKFIVTASNINIDLIYNGVVDEEKPKYVYYVNDDVNNNIGDAVRDGKYKIEKFEPINIPNDKYLNVIDDISEYVFYIVRHGQATHNILKGTWNKLSTQGLGESYKDTSLTDNGIEQAKDIGMELNRILGGTAIDYCFASDLKRTRETIYYMNDGLKELAKANVAADNDPVRDTIPASHSNISLKDVSLYKYLQQYPIIVLPCSHEIDYDTDYLGRSCDNASALSGTPNENISLCDEPNLRDRNNVDKCRIIQNDVRANISWRHYADFYEGTRKRPGKKGNNCLNTDMIKQAMEYINATDVTGRPLRDDDAEDESVSSSLKFSPPVLNPKCSGRFYRWTHPNGCRGYQKVAAASGGTKRRRGKMTRGRNNKRRRGRRTGTRKRKNVRRTTRRR